MAWKKAGGQKKPCPVQKAPGQPCLPDLETRAAPSSSVRLKYEELQKNELMVLQSIYGDDFVEHKAGHSAWQVSRKWEPTHKGSGR